jgi:NAD(P)-dependent dehydrogenase (short-subunit alcohol dehydrogenase family)
MRDSEQVDAFVADVVESLGSCHACVLAAGVAGPVGPVDTTTDDELAAVFDVNVFAMFRVLRAVLPVLRRRGGGRVVALASGAGIGGAAYIAPYAASKHAVIGLARSVALEEAASGISMNAVCPGLVDSPMLHRIELATAAITGVAPDAPPMRRNADPNEVAELVVYLVLSAPAYITGAALSIDGGLRA